jgi:hypothetical protein
MQDLKAHEQPAQLESDGPPQYPTLPAPASERPEAPFSPVQDSPTIHHRGSFRPREPRTSDSPGDVTSDDWLDRCDTLPVPRPEASAPAPQSAHDAQLSEPVALAPQPSDTQQQASQPPAARQPASEQPQPPELEPTTASSVVAETPATHEASDGASDSAQVLPATDAGEHAPPEEVRSEATTSTATSPENGPADEATNTPGRPWLWAATAVAASAAAIWWGTHSGAASGVVVSSNDVAERSYELRTNAAPAAFGPSEPLAPLAPAQASDVVSPVDQPLAAIAAEDLPAERAAEPDRIVALTNVAVAAKSAGACRKRGDSAGNLRVAVTFNADGRVRRTLVLGNLSNPATRECITSKFSDVTVPSFTGDPITVTGAVRLH